ncbi:aldo/keto reductase [Marinactinospora thermotolerans]|uniref:Predicted oxidoreductase n=1 Tax=Marinactinospora thermotolerans DSM 45154 TaxID=1122192 RepID=A0A1T4NM15_9ACTN|nr:aldo/keto reductase [Marinactinospora thermotolerans]SJZ80137.1 Predicted oxidoreductase [Marinactinospora thermotolerans DSM 45154]
MEQRTLGEVQVGAIGLGAMPLSVDGGPEPQRAIRTVHAALDAGVTLIDTADAYQPKGAGIGHNEELVARALASYGGDTSRVLVATKGGHVRTPDGGWDLDGRPEHLKAAAKASAARLGVEAIGLYQHHRPDPRVPYEETIGALAELLDEGVIRMAGISNADEGQIRTAQEVLGGRLAAVQNQFSPAFRSSRGELELCARSGIAFLPWSPLGGIANAGRLAQRHEVFAQVAAEHGVSPQQVCLAWELSLSPTVIPIPGASRPQSITDSAQAVDLELSPEQLALLDAAA